jgi:transposase
MVSPVNRREANIVSAERDGLIDDQIRGSAVWVEKEDLLASVPGVGKTIAQTLIAELPELGSLDR